MRRSPFNAAFTQHASRSTPRPKEHHHALSLRSPDPGSLSQGADVPHRDAASMVYNAQSGHIGGAFSVAEILAALYFHHLKIDPARPDWPERDRLLFSKGHACAALYSALAYRGFFPVEELLTFRQLDSRLQGHPDRSKTAGDRSLLRAAGARRRRGGRHGVGAAYGRRQAIGPQRGLGAGLRRQDLCHPWRWRDQRRRGVGGDDEPRPSTGWATSAPSWTTTASSRRGQRPT